MLSSCIEWLTLRRALEQAHRIVAQNGPMRIEWARRAKRAAAAGERMLFGHDRVRGKNSDSLALDSFVESAGWALRAAAGLQAEASLSAVADALAADSITREFMRALAEAGLPLDALSEDPATRAGMPEGLLRERAERVQPVVRRYVQQVESKVATPCRVLQRRWAQGFVVALVATVIALSAHARLRPVIEQWRHPNVALGKPWTASGSFEGAATSGRIGRIAANFFFITNRQTNPWVRIDLLDPRSVGGVTVTNRIDCCRARAVPLIVEVSTDGVSWQEVVRRDENFDTWRAHFAPRVARFVRLRASTTTWLHLAGVAVHDR
jgi:hypothetical protein